MQCAESRLITIEPEDPVTAKEKSKAKPKKKPTTSKAGKRTLPKPLPPVAKDLPPGTVLKAPPKNNGKHPGGRPTKYLLSFNERAYEYCLLKNATDPEIAKYLNVTESTLNLWKIEHPEFSEAIEAGKEQADAKVAAGLFKRAAGQTVVRTHIRFHKGKMIKGTFKEEILADPRAAELWLRNRQGKKWSKPTGGDTLPTGILGIHIHESLKPTSK
jgi:hypothetical protein